MMKMFWYDQLRLHLSPNHHQFVECATVGFLGSHLQRGERKRGERSRGSCREFVRNSKSQFVLSTGYAEWLSTEAVEQSVEQGP